MNPPLDARVLLVARDDALAGPLSLGLDRLGWRTATARGPYAALAVLADMNIEAVILDVASCGQDPATLTRRIRAAASPRLLPVVAIGEPGAADSAIYDLTLPSPLHPSQAAIRLNTLVRMAIAEEEVLRRLDTFAEQGTRLDLPQPPEGPARVLAVGEPAPQFLALSNALTGAGAEVVGAFTAYTAFDYLHEKPFDAVVVWTGEDQTEALSITGGMRRNTRLYHTPTLLYMKAGAAFTPAEAYNRGVSDIATPETPPEQTAKRIIELARAHRRHQSIREALERARSSGLMDAATGLFTRGLFAAHLARLAREAENTRRPLSLCVLRIAERPELIAIRKGGWVDRATPQIGSMIGRLVRYEDTAARLAPDVFALALPATKAAAAQATAERIAAVVACTAFEAGENRPPFTVEFDVGVTEVAPGENPARALERAAMTAVERKAG
ncbi:MAG: diguanylate cyclase domain-containing protein [Caulobacteraceae bacterium]